MSDDHAVEFFLGALQWFVLGIIGECLGRLLMEGKARPFYFIAETLPEAKDGRHEPAELDR